MRFERTRVLETARVVARALQLALCAAALVAIAIKFFVVAFLVVAACLGMLVAVIDGFPQWCFDRHHGAGGRESDAAATPSRLARVLTQHLPYSKRQTVDMLLALLLLAAAVVFLASDTMDAACGIASSKSVVDQATDAAESVIDSLGLDGDGSESSSSSTDGGDASSVGCTAVKASVGCALSATFLFLVTLALTCPPFAKRNEELEDGERATDADSRKSSTEHLGGGSSDREDAYRRLEGGSPTQLLSLQLLHDFGCGCIYLYLYVHVYGFGKMLKVSRTLLRFLQFACSLVALVTLSASFTAASYYGYSTMLGSSAVTFATLMTYTGMLVGLYYFLLAELFPVSPRPPLLLEQLGDLVMSVVLLIAAIVLLVSDYVQHCDVYGFMLRCSPITSAVVFIFLVMGFFLATMLLAFCERRQQKSVDGSGGGSNSNTNNREFGSAADATGQYHAEETPTAERV